MQRSSSPRVRAGRLRVLAEGVNDGAGDCDRSERHTHKGGFLTRRGLAYVSWYKVRKAIGAKGVPFHATRHAYASQLHGRQVDVFTISRAMGHDSLTETLETYLHSDEDRERAAADVWDEIVGN